MKKIKYFSLFLMSFLLFGINVFAAPSANLSVSKGTIENGSSVTATATISNVAAWQATIRSTGATSGCTKTFSDVTSDGNDTTTKLSVTCKSTSTGTINFSLSGNATSSDGTKVQLSGNKEVSVTVPREKSKNNKLKSLSVEGYEISPAFESGIKEYSVTVPSTVDKINIEAKKADSYASLDGTGEKTIEEGVNTFEIIVTSETGVSNTYKLIVNVEDLNPINVTVDKKKYTVVKVAKNLTKPELFEETTIKIGDFDIPAFVNEVSKYTLVGLKDEEGNISLFIYEDGKYKKYNEFRSDNLVIVFLDMKKIPSNYIKASIKITDENIVAYKLKGDKKALLYGLNMATGKENYYSYESTEKTLQLFDVDKYESSVKEEKNNQYLIYGLSVVVLLVIILLLLVTSKNRKINKIIKSKINREEPEKVKEEIIEKSEEESEEEYDDPIIEIKKKKRKKNK